jgi:hypothetical protein
MDEGAAAFGVEERPVPTPLEIFDGTHPRIRIDTEEAGQLPDARRGLVSRDAAALDDVLALLRRLAADRDRALRVHWPAHRDHPRTV